MAETSDAGAQVDPADPSSIFEAYQRQQQDIETEVNMQQVLLSPKLPTSSLLGEYSDDAVFTEKCEELSQNYKQMRKTRGDGNCFYRGFSFAYLDYLRDKPKEAARLREMCRERKDAIIQLGYSSVTVEDFYDSFCEIVSSVEKGCSIESLEEVFNDQGQSDYIVVFMRLLVSGHLQRNAEFFQNFLDREITIKEFCASEVEPMKHESDHIHIIALTQTLETSIAVEYMHREGKGVNKHTFPDHAAQPALTLLYRPGHYDILYQN